MVISLLDRKWYWKNIDYSFNGEDLYVVGDEKLLEQVWINILDNAVKFSPEGGSVKIECTNNNDNVSFTFINQSEEISADGILHVFDEFYQGNISHTIKGNGLGLSVVKKIIALHKGSVGAEYRDGQFIFTVNFG